MNNTNKQSINLHTAVGVNLPEYQTLGSAGADVVAHSILAVYQGSKPKVNEDLEKVQKSFQERRYIMIRGFERILFGTGLTLVDMPENFEIQLRSRSGTVLKKGLSVLNAPGTIDSDYRGEIGVILYNNSPFLAKVELDERVAQIVLKQVEIADYSKSDITQIKETSRKGGFGHTGNI